MNSIASLDMYVANGTSEAAIAEATPVTASVFNFTYPNTRNFYIVARAQQGSSVGDHALDVTFRYYEYDPKCHYYQDWNGTDCKNNYTRYCGEMTEEWREKLDNPDAVVVYNGSACVIAQSFTATVTTTIENVTVKYQVVDETPPDDYLEAQAKSKAYQDALRNTPNKKADDSKITYDKGLTLNNDKRSQQRSQVILGVSILIGSIFYAVSEAVAARR